MNEDTEGNRGSRLLALLITTSMNIHRSRDVVADASVNTVTEKIKQHLIQVLF